MVIYDKNQMTFNILFSVILLTSIVLNVIFATNFELLENRFMQVNDTLGKVEVNQNFNFIQGAHNDIEYSLTEHGFLVRSADDSGLFNGPSMQPVIYDQNTLIEKTYNGENLTEGQVVRFLRDNGDAIVHRVRADYGDTIFVQGDSLKDGEIISKDKVTHIVVGVLYT
jgi:hypothetical protein